MNYTLFIPTKNRLEYVRRNLDHLSGFKFSGVVFILDSSDVEDANSIRDTLSYYSNLNVQYRHLPGLPWQVMKAAISEVKTDYVSFGGDDDFLAPKAINHALDALDRDHQFASAIGEIVLAKINDKTGLIDFFAPYEPATPSKSSRIERIQDLFKNYQVPLFAIYRRSAFAEILNHVPTYKEYDQCPVWSISDEFLPSALAVGVGKTHHINQLFMVRAIHKDRYRMPEIEKINGPLFDKAGTYFRSQLKRFAMKEQCDEATVENVLDEFLYNLRYKKKKRPSSISHFFSLAPKYQRHHFKRKLPWIFSRKTLVSDFIKNHKDEADLRQICGFLDKDLQ